MTSAAPAIFVNRMRMVQCVRGPSHHAVCGTESYVEGVTRED